MGEGSSLPAPSFSFPCGGGGGARIQGRVCRFRFSIWIQYLRPTGRLGRMATMNAAHLCMPMHTPCCRHGGRLGRSQKCQNGCLGAGTSLRCTFQPLPGHRGHTRPVLEWEGGSWEVSRPIILRLPAVGKAPGGGGGVAVTKTVGGHFRGGQGRLQQKRPPSSTGAGSSFSGAAPNLDRLPDPEAIPSTVQSCLILRVQAIETRQSRAPS